MTWFAAGAAVATTLYSVRSAAKSSAQAAGSQSRAEGEAIAKDRLNATIRNSYQTAAAQLQLGLKKRQLAQQGADIRAASLAARGNADLVTAATGSIGASTNAVVSDIDQKTQAALDATRDSFENTLENYNQELAMMVVNTDQSSPTPRQVEYNGPSSAQMLGGALLTGAGSFASNYAMRKMSLGVGSSANVASPSGVTVSSLGDPS